MIRETGVVTEVEGNYIQVASQLKSGCSGCAQRNTCGAGLISKALPERTSTIRLQAEGVYTPGQHVELQMAEATMAGYSLLIYLVPLFALFSGAGLGQWLFAGHELAAIAGGFIAFAGSFLVLKRWLSCRKLRVQQLISVQPSSSEPQ